MDGLDIDLTTPPRRKSTRKPTHTAQPQVKSDVLDRRKRRRDALDQDDEDEPTAGNSSLTHAEQPQAKSSGSSRKRCRDALDQDDKDEPSPKNTHNGFTLPANTKTPFNNRGLDPHCVFKWLAIGTFQSVLCEKVYTLLASYYPSLRPWFSARATTPAWIAKQAVQYMADYNRCFVPSRQRPYVSGRGAIPRTTQQASVYVES